MTIRGPLTQGRKPSGSEGQRITFQGGTGDVKQGEIPARLGFKDFPFAKTPYIVTIFSRLLNTTVYAFLQEDIQFRVDSNWATMVPSITTSPVGELINLVAQAASSGRFSLVNKMTSRRYWKGSTPITLNLNLRFEALEDARTEVHLPCMALQQMASPSDAKGNFLAPPGPSPFKFFPSEKVPGGSKTVLAAQERLTQISKFVTAGADTLTCQIGRALTFNNVILKSVGIRMAPRMNAAGFPVAAVADVVIETYEVLTKDALRVVYNESPKSVR